MSASFPILAVADHPTPFSDDNERAGIQDLLQVLEPIRDPRNPRGRRYRLPLLLALAVLAVTAGARTFTEIAEHSADLSPRMRVWLGVRSWCGTPSGWTFARALAAIDHDTLTHALSDWSRGNQPSATVAVDGKTMRGAVTGKISMPRRHVVAALNDHGEVLGQTTVDDGNENAAARTLLSCVDSGLLSGAVVTADAKHTGAGFTTLVEAAGALLAVTGPAQPVQPAHTADQFALEQGDYQRPRPHPRARTRRNPRFESPHARR